VISASGSTFGHRRVIPQYGQHETVIHYFQQRASAARAGISRHWNASAILPSAWISLPRQASPSSAQPEVKRSATPWAIRFRAFQEAPCAPCPSELTVSNVCRQIITCHSRVPIGLSLPASLLVLHTGRCAPGCSRYHCS
jgi:hypothetical protein